MSKLKFIALSGTTDVTENLYIYEYENDMIVVDCGIGFPESEMYGVDLIIPDFTYIKKNKHKLRGILISHGHEDHLGALPFLLKDIGDVPVYATKLVAGFIESKYKDHKLKGKKVNVFDPDKDVLSLGSFKITPFRVSHSVPDGVGYAIDSPEGRAFHVADYKFDWTPVDQRPFDISKVAILASEGALILASDAIGSTSPGYTESEKDIEVKIEEIVRKAKRLVYFTTISSNISRMQQALNVAQKVGRKVAFVGRSIEDKKDVAEKLGFLSYPRDLVVPVKNATKLPREKAMYIISGSYGQPGSALDRVSRGDHDFLSASKGDTVVFSSDPAPPGSKATVDAVVDRFLDMNVGVHYYDLQEDLHVSGHGSMGDIKMLFSIIKPKYFVPIGGTIRHNRGYRNIAEDMGNDPNNVFELTPGGVIEFENGNATRGKKVRSEHVLVDGLGIGDVGNVVLRDRHRLSQDGVVIVLMRVDKPAGKLIEAPEVISRGFVFERQKKGFLEHSARQLRQRIEKRKKVTKDTARTDAIDFLEKFFWEETRRRPMILPVVVEV